MTFSGFGLILKPLETGDANFKALRPIDKDIGIDPAAVRFEKGFIYDENIGSNQRSSQEP